MQRALPTTKHREAEFARDRLLQQVPYWIHLLAIMAISALLWWIAR